MISLAVNNDLDLITSNMQMCPGNCKRIHGHQTRESLIRLGQERRSDCETGLGCNATSSTGESPAWLLGHWYVSLGLRWRAHVAFSEHFSEADDKEEPLCDLGSNMKALALFLPFSPEDRLPGELPHTQVSCVPYLSGCEDRTMYQLELSVTC